MVSESVLDASVLLAIFRGEPFEHDILDVLEGSVMSATNLAEVLTRLIDLGIPLSSPGIAATFALLDRIEPFTEAQARVAAGLRSETRHAGLSLADRSCLALALEIGADVYTADRPWSRVDIGCKIHLIR